MSVAGDVRQSKDKHPDKYCAEPRCLWRLTHRDGRITPCPKHRCSNCNAPYGVPCQEGCPRAGSR